MLSREEVHLATGMKVSEIVDIQETGDGYRVTTHDGQHIDLERVAAPESEKPAEPEPEPEAPSLDAVLDGSAETVLAWVGDDRERAGRALEAEQAREQPRKGLVEKLQKLAG